MVIEDDRPAHSLERLVFFSDAVFAIAITLLIIEIHVPALPYGSPSHAYIDALLELWPNVFGFVVSFFVIGAFWAGHHRGFALAGHYSDKLLAPNLQMLCAIAFLPFATAFMSRNNGMLVPSVFYAATLLLIGLLNVRLVRLITSPPVVRHDVGPDIIAYSRARGIAVVLGAACSLGVAFIDARFSQLGLISIPIWQRVLRGIVARRLRA